MAVGHPRYPSPPRTRIRMTRHSSSRWGARRASPGWPDLTAGLLASTPVSDTALSAPVVAPRTRPRPQRRFAGPIRRRPWITMAVVVVLVAIGFVLATGVRPAYDAYGWLVWGRQAAHVHLNTSAAPSWKPLAFLFTFPYALLVGRAALWLWMVTATAAGLAAAVFAARIAYRLSAPATGHRYAAFAGAAFAGVGVLGIAGYWHFVLIATADPMMVALSLAAVDCAL